MDTTTTAYLRTDIFLFILSLKYHCGAVLFMYEDTLLRKNTQKKLNDFILWKNAPISSLKKGKEICLCEMLKENKKTEVRNIEMCGKM